MANSPPARTFSWLPVKCDVLCPCAQKLSLPSNVSPYQVQRAVKSVKQASTWGRESAGGRPRRSGVRSISRSVREIADARVDGATMKRKAIIEIVNQLVRNYARVYAKQGSEFSGSLGVPRELVDTTGRSFGT